MEYKVRRRRAERRVGHHRRLLDARLESVAHTGWGRCVERCRLGCATAALLNDGPPVVSVPRPEIFAFHGLIVSHERKGNDHLKALKDAAQACALITNFVGTKIPALRDTHEHVTGRGSGWRKAGGGGNQATRCCVPGQQVAERLWTAHFPLRVAGTSHFHAKRFVNSRLVAASLRLEIRQDVRVQTYRSQNLGERSLQSTAPIGHGRAQQVFGPMAAPS